MRALLFLSLVFVAFSWEIQIEPSSSSFIGHEGVKVNIVVKNTASTPRKLLKWGTPFDFAPFSSDILNFDCTGGVARYIGILAKRALSLDSFVAFQPQESIRTTVDLATGYYIPAGHCNVTLASKFGWVYHGANASHPWIDMKFKAIRSGSVQFTMLSTTPRRPFPEPAKTNRLGDATFSRCTLEQESIILLAEANAKAIARNALASLLEESCDENYRTWFGACDASREATILSHFQAIHAAFEAGFIVDCQGELCDSDKYAYVYRADSTHVIYVCHWFWEAQTSVEPCQYDSKPGVLVHEMSHFDDIAGTWDHEYGTDGCMSLATQDPALAIVNADSHEYFAETCDAACLLV